MAKMKSKMGMKSKMATKKRGKVANGGKMKKKPQSGHNRLY